MTILLKGTCTMELFCIFCSCNMLFRWVRDRVGRSGETWEDYQCQGCGHERSFCTR